MFTKPTFLNQMIRRRLEPIPDKRQATVTLTKRFLYPAGLLDRVTAVVKMVGYGVIIIHRARGDSVEIAQVIDKRK